MGTPELGTYHTLKARLPSTLQAHPLPVNTLFFREKALAFYRPTPEKQKWRAIFARVNTGKTVFDNHT